MSKTYFANLEITELLPVLISKVEDFNSHAERSGRRLKWEKAHKYYFGEHMGESGGRATNVESVGTNGELKAFGVNHFRNLIKHVIAIATAQKPSYDPRAKNTDLESQQQARLANNIIDAYVTEKRLGRHQLLSAERSVVYGTGFLYMPWNPSLGKPYTSTMVEGPNGEPVERILYEGDVEPSAKSPFDVIYDHRLREWTQNRWVIVREYENKWDLAARHPELAEEILAFEPDDNLDMRSMTLGLNKYLEDKQERDLIPIFHFYHLRTEAAPNGRYVKFINNKLSLFDGAIPYRKRLPVFRMSPGEIFDQADGYTDAQDILVLQQVLNTLHSTAFTNQQALGVQVIWMPDTCQVSPTQMGKGLALLKGGPPGSEPKAINLVATAPEIYKSADAIKSSMTEIMGLNKVVTGDPEHNLKSGIALARLQAMAIQYSSNFQKAWADLLEDTGTFLLELLQDFATTERMVAIAGKHNKGAMASFTGKDLSEIERVSVDLGNPMQNTASGRIEMAETLLSKGAIDAKQYVQVAATGNLETATEAQTSQEELIRKENECLMDGKPVQAVIGDLHLMHSKEHMVVINDPLLREMQARGDQKAIAVVQATLNHIMEHKQLYETQEPFFGMISGEPPPPMPPPAPGPGPQGPPPPEPGVAPEPPPPGMAPEAQAPPVPPMAPNQPPPLPIQ